MNIPWKGWKVTRPLGGGNYGKVYEIERTDSSGHAEKATMKVFTVPRNPNDIDLYQASGFDDARVSEKFRKELEPIMEDYRLMASMKGHSNIVSVEDVNAVRHTDDPGWDVFIRMEPLTPLLDRLKKLKGTMDEKEIIRLGKDMCQALSLCHGHNIIHRDIKPDNIFISEYGDYKLGDFGVAGVPENNTSGTSAAGTYLYMAPEAAKSESYGKEAAIYSLGMILYWLLNRMTLPFLMIGKMPGDPEIERTIHRRIYEKEKIPAPSEGSSELKRIVLKALAYKPKDRYHSAEEMLADLNRADESGKTELPWPEWKILEEKGDGVCRIGKGLNKQALLKVIHIKDGDSEDTVNEYRQLKKLAGNKNIIKIEEITEVLNRRDKGKDIFIRMEAAETLRETARKKPLKPKDVQKLGEEICAGLRVCQKVDTDTGKKINPDGVFRSADGIWKIGVPLTVSDDIRYYVAPEVRMRGKYDSRAGVYSLGKLMYWLLNEGKMPDTGSQIPMPLQGSDELKHVVMNACRDMPDERFSSPLAMQKKLFITGHLFRKLMLVIFFLPVFMIDRFLNFCIRKKYVTIAVIVITALLIGIRIRFPGTAGKQKTDIPAEVLADEDLQAMVQNLKEGDWLAYALKNRDYLAGSTPERIEKYLASLNYYFQLETRVGLIMEENNEEQEVNEYYTEIHPRSGREVILTVSYRTDHTINGCFVSVLDDAHEMLFFKSDQYNEDGILIDRDKTGSYIFTNTVYENDRLIEAETSYIFDDYKTSSKAVYAYQNEVSLGLDKEVKPETDANVSRYTLLDAEGKVLYCSSAPANGKYSTDSGDPGEVYSYYDKEGNLITELAVCEEDGQREVRMIEYTYEDGNCVSQVCYDEDHKVISSLRMEYNEHNELSEKYDVTDGTEKLLYTQSVLYDSKDRPVRREAKTYLPEESSSVAIYRYE